MIPNAWEKGFEKCDRLTGGGLILQIPDFSAIARMLAMYDIVSLNSSQVGLKTGQSGGGTNPSPPFVANIFGYLDAGCPAVSRSNDPRQRRRLCRPLEAIRQLKTRPLLLLLLAFDLGRVRREKLLIDDIVSPPTRPTECKQRKKIVL